MDIDSPRCERKFAAGVFDMQKNGLVTEEIF